MRFTGYKITFFYEGSYDDNLLFEFGENTDPYNGCAVTFNGEMLYFGGGGRQGDPKQVLI